KAEQRIDAHFDSVESTIQRRRQQAAGRRDVDALANAMATTGPAGVQQPGLRTTLTQTLGQHLAVNRWVQRHKWRAEAGREGRLRLGDAPFSACNLGGITRQEVINSLLRRQTRQRRQNTKSVSSQEHHSLRRTTN